MGAVVIGGQTPTQPVLRMVTDRADIRPIRSALLLRGAVLGDVPVKFLQLLEPEYARESTSALHQQCADPGVFRQPLSVFLDFYRTE